jgi:hypothetical protein
VQLKIVLEEETPSRTSDRQSPNFVQRDSYGAELPTVDANMAGSHTPRFEVDQLAAANTFSAHVNQCSIFWIANCLIEKVRAIGYHMAVSQEGYFAGYTMIPVFGVLLPPGTSIAKGVSRRAAGLTMLCVMCYASRKSSVVF